MNTTRRQQTYTIGGILKIPLNDGYYTYGQMIGDAQVAFFDARTEVDLALGEVISRPVLFRLAVYSDTISKSIWPRVGKLPLSDELKEPQPMFIQDALNPDKYQIYYDGNIRPATKEECVGLECCAVWEPEHVVERINDYYRGKRSG